MSGLHLLGYAERTETRTVATRHVTHNALHLYVAHVTHVAYVADITHVADVTHKT